MNRPIFALLSTLLALGSAYTINAAVRPEPLHHGDTIAICSPAYHINTSDVDNAKALFESQGWVVEIMPSALGHWGDYAGTDSARLADLRQALTRPDIKAIFCARGGYGAVHLLPGLDSIASQITPKWLVGFSDITALHAWFSKQGIMSIHGPMANTFHGDSTSTNLLLDALKGETPPIEVNGHHLNRYGNARGQIIGGNFAVLAHLVSTPYDMIRPGTILFIEDVDEPIYKIERVLWQLKLSGALGRLAGIIVGEFRNYEPFSGYRTMEQMISAMIADYDYPVAFGIPVGHGHVNHPLIESATIDLTVTPFATKITYLD